jgi:hypothetical protein
MILYHYSCRHGADAIHRDGGLLRPHQHPWLPEPLLWLTDLDVPHREGLGLTSITLHCDRTEFRFAVDTTTAIWWPQYAHRINRSVRAQFDAAAGAMPAHWWVSFTDQWVDPRVPA